MALGLYNCHQYTTNLIFLQLFNIIALKNYIYRDESESALRAHLTENLRRRTGAKKHLVEAKRKIRMAQLLLSGGFLAESVAPTIESLELEIKGYAALGKGGHQNGCMILTDAKGIGANSSGEGVLVMLARVNSCLHGYSVEIES